MDTKMSNTRAEPSNTQPSANQAMSVKDAAKMLLDQYENDLSRDPEFPSPKKTRSRKPTMSKKQALASGYGKEVANSGLEIDDVIDETCDALRKIAIDIREAMIETRRSQDLVEHLLNDKSPESLSAFVAGLDTEQNVDKKKQMLDAKEMMDFCETQMTEKEYILNGIYLFYTLPRQIHIMLSVKSAAPTDPSNYPLKDNRPHRPKVNERDVPTIGGYPGRSILTSEQQKKQSEALLKEDHSRILPFFTVAKIDELLDLDLAQWLAKILNDRMESLMRNQGSDSWADDLEFLRTYDLESAAAIEEAAGEDAVDGEGSGEENSHDEDNGDESSDEEVSYSDEDDLEGLEDDTEGFEGEYDEDTFYDDFDDEVADDVTIGGNVDKGKEVENSLGRIISESATAENDSENSGRGESIDSLKETFDHERSED